MSKQQDAFKRCDEISDELEVFFNSLSKKNKREIGKLICGHIATLSADLDKNIFDPLKVLSEAQKDLQAIIAEEVDGQIEKELLDYVNKTKDQK